MNQIEISIAEKVSNDQGLNVKVRLLEKEDFSNYFQFGYGAPFIFSEPSEKEERYFILTHELEEVQVKKIFRGSYASHEQQKPDRSLLEKYFSKFLPLKIEPFPVSWECNNADSSFDYHFYLSLLHFLVPTPPPWHC